MADDDGILRTREELGEALLRCAKQVAAALLRQHWPYDDVEEAMELSWLTVIKQYSDLRPPFHDEVSERLLTSYLQRVMRNHLYDLGRAKKRLQDPELLQKLAEEVRQSNKSSALVSADLQQA